jgi:hypothetical protein
MALDCVFNYAFSQAPSFDAHGGEGGTRQPVLVTARG